MSFENERMLVLTAASSAQYVRDLLEEFKISVEIVPLDIFRKLFRNENAVKYFKFNIDRYCEFHRLVIPRFENPVQFALYLYDEHIFHKSIRDREQFGNNFLEIVIPPLVEACNKFNDPAVFEAASEVFQKCIFSSKEFTCYFTDLFEKKKCPEKHSLCKSVLKFCSLLHSPETTKTGFRLVFNAFCKSFKNFSYSYKMLIILTEMIGFEVREEFSFNKIKYQINEPSLNNSLHLINELLGVICKTKFEVDYKINDVTFSDFIKNLARSVIALSQTPNTCCYQIFLKIIEINPLIIESIISEVLIYIMLADNSKCKKEYEELMTKIFELFNKLHRIQNLIAKMIPTLKTALEDRKLNETVYTFRGNVDLQLETNISYNIDDILPTSILNFFTSCIINLASWQVINLFKTLLHHLRIAVESINEVKEENVYIEILSTFTCWLLMSVRMAEHTIAGNTVVKFVEGLEELKSILGKLGATLLQKEHNHVLMRAFLNISYYWAEIYMTLEYYSTSTEVRMARSIDSNFSACNLTYLHPYLSDKEWCLISERINNFGEKPCKEIMQKLMIQKLRALLLFGESSEDLTTPVIRNLSCDFDAESVELLTDKFVVHTILDKMPESFIVNLAEALVQVLLEDDTKLLDRPHIYDSPLIMKGFLCVIFTKINKLLKQKRKHDDTTLRKALFSKAISVLPSATFLAKNVDDFRGNIAEILISETEEPNIDLKMLDDKIEMHLDILSKLPIVFSPQGVQEIVMLLLMTLHKDIKNNNSGKSLKAKCESLIISIVQHSRLTLLDIFDPITLIKILVDDFDRSEDLFLQIAQSIFKNGSVIIKFEPGVTYINENLKNVNCMKFAVILLHIVSKIKKTKLSAKSKEMCLKFKSEICHKVVKIISKNRPEDHLIQAYALVLKTYLAKDENNGLSKLTAYLADYVEYCVINLSDDNVKGSLLLFTTILHNKSIVSDFDDSLILRIWNTMKTTTVKNDGLEDYSQLVMLITTLIPNEQFSNIFEDLLKITEKSIASADNKECSNHIKTWSYIVSTDFNPIKTKILREQLEFLLEKLLLMLRSVHYSQELCEEVIQFEISIIQTTHIPITAAIMDVLLLSVPNFVRNDSDDFVRSFSCGVNLLESLLKYRNPLIMDRLPPFLAQYRHLLDELCSASGSHLDLPQNEVQKFADCAHRLEQLTKSLVECTKDMSRIAMYLISDLLKTYELDTLYPNVKKHLNNCIYSLISLCDQHSVQYLMRALSNASREIFKLMYENYKKYYRFTGKV